MKYTTNLNLKKPDYIDLADIQDINDNMDKLDTELGVLKGYATTTGSANTYAANIPGISNLVAGLRVTVRFNVANTNASTLNVNGLGAKSIRKAGGATLSSGNLKANGIYSLVYDGTNFQLQGEGGEYGTAVASDVLSGKTIGTESGIIPGTMPNRAGNNNALNVARSGTILRLRAPQGYYDGLDDIVQATSADWIAENILEGKSIFGLVGTLAQGKKWASGTKWGQNTISVSGLAFEPTFFVAFVFNNNNAYCFVVYDALKSATTSYYGHNSYGGNTNATVTSDGITVSFNPFSGTFNWYAVG